MADVLFRITFPADWYQYKRSAEKKAHLFTVIEKDGQRDVWLPKSLVTEWKQKDKQISFDLPHWLIEKHFLDAFVDTSGVPALFDFKLVDEERIFAESDERSENFHNNKDEKYRNLDRFFHDEEGVF